MSSCDILIPALADVPPGSPSTSPQPPQRLSVVIAGRNALRLNWLRRAANARARLFGTQARFTTYTVDLLAPGASEAMLEATNPRVVAHAASIQTLQVIVQTGNAWTRLVGARGLSATAVFQALLSARVAAAITQRGRPVSFVNCGFPDVVNGLIMALGHKVTCGMGNVAILSNVFGGSAGTPEGAEAKVLAHYQNLAAWRKPPHERHGRAPRVWIGRDEVADAFSTFADIQPTPESVIEISGASGVPMLLAMAFRREWRGHVPGPNGLPGGYPVRLLEGELVLDLPDGLDANEAIRWNASFEAENAMVVAPDAHVVFTGVLLEKLGKYHPSLRSGFAARDIETVCEDLLLLRRELAQTQ